MENITNLHIFQDGLGYFLNRTVKRIERIQSGQNVYLNLCDSKNKNESVVYIDYCNKKALKNFLNKIPNLLRVYFHFYNYKNIYLLDIIKEKENVVVAWVFWSGEFYNLPKFEREYFGPFSRKFVFRENQLKTIIKKRLSDIKSILTNRPYLNHDKLIASYLKIDFFASFLEQDYENVKSYSHAKFQYVAFSYLSFEEIISENLIDQFSRGKAIMINHSADPSLNHYEIIMELHKRSLQNKIFLPLAYGDSHYADLIGEYAVECFGNNVEIQRSFLAPEDYGRKMLMVGFAIFNIKIQQGLGNILALLWLGVKVFLKESNSTYVNLKKWGFHIYSIENDLPRETFIELMKIDLVEKNRSLISERFSEKKVNEYFLNLLTIKK